VAQVGYSLALVGRLVRAYPDTVVGLKDSSGDLPAYKRLLELRTARPDWSFFIGPESLLAESVRAGGDGAG